MYQIEALLINLMDFWSRILFWLSSIWFCDKINEIIFDKTTFQCFIMDVGSVGFVCSRQNYVTKDIIIDISVLCRLVGSWMFDISVDFNGHYFFDLMPNFSCRRMEN
jgi:hypothetical protein